MNSVGVFLLACGVLALVAGIVIRVRLNMKPIVERRGEFFSTWAPIWGAVAIFGVFIVNLAVGTRDTPEWLSIVAGVLWALGSIIVLTTKLTEGNYRDGSPNGNASS